MDIQTLISAVHHLSPAPKIIPRLQKILRDPDSSLDEVANLIRLDPSLAAQILRVSNSAYYGGAGHCHSIEEAAGRIGFQEVFELVGAIVSNSVLGGHMPVYNIQAGQLWAESIACGIAMQGMAESVDMEEDTAYTVGLLHAVGKVLINHYHVEHGIPGYIETLEAMTPAQELGALGFTYAHAGATLLRKWEFDEIITVPIEYHLEPLMAPLQRPGSLLLAVVKDAVRLCGSEEELAHEQYNPPAEWLAELGLEREMILEKVTDAFERVDILASTF